MKVFLMCSGKRIKAAPPFYGADHAVVEGSCQHGQAQPFKVCGKDCHPSDDDRAWEAAATCMSCGRHVGTLRAEMNTLFGVREDEAVLNSRYRVYG